MTNILISVVVPHYNSGGLLKRLLRSIPNQEDIQVIVVDDCSSDNSFSDLSRHDMFSHVLFIESDKKLTAGGARNIGLQHAEGDFLLFADSDDYFNSDAFETIRDATNEGCDLTLFKVSSFMEGKEQAGDRHLYLESIYKEPGLFKFLAIDQPCGKLIRKQLLEDYNIRFSKVPAGNDILFSAKVSLYAKSRRFVEKQIYLISQNTSSITAQFNFEKDKSKLQEHINKTLLLKSLTHRWFWLLFLCRRNALTLCQKHPESLEYQGLANFYRKMMPGSAILIHKLFKWFVP